jgi:hypothetical protein
MPAPSNFERAQIDALLCPKPRPLIPNSATYLCPLLPDYDFIFETAISPALTRNAIEVPFAARVFNSDSPLATACERLQTSELLIFDLTHAVPHLLYTLGLAHAMGRCPLLISQPDTPSPPFDLTALRRFEYTPDADGLHTLRESLTRAIRIHLAVTRTPPADGLTQQ